MHGEAAVVEDARGHGQGQALGQGEDLVFRSRRCDVRPADQEGPLGVEEGIPDGADDARLRHQPHVGRVRSLDDGLHVGRLQRRARVGHVDRARRVGGGVLERAPRDGRDSPGLPHLPSPLGDVLDGAHLGEPRARHQRAVVAVGSDVAHGRGHHHGRAVEVRVLELAGTLPRSRGQVHVDEGWPARCLGIAVGRREHERLREEQDRLHAGDGQEGIEEPGLRAAGIGERVADPLGQQLMDQELPARPEYTPLLHASAPRVVQGDEGFSLHTMPGSTSQWRSGRSGPGTASRAWTSRGSIRHTAPVVRPRQGELSMRRTVRHPRRSPLPSERYGPKRTRPRPPSGGPGREA
jgi:hypothetical protein